MTLDDAVLFSLLRCVLLATLAIRPARVICRYCYEAASSSSRRFRMVISLAPLFVPELLLGFTWRLAAAGLTHSRLGTECLYSILQLARCISLSVAAHLVLYESAVSGESLHSWRLLKPSTEQRRTASLIRWWSTWIQLRLLGPWRSTVIGWCLSALLCFQEFETVALLQIDRFPIAWTVWLFDAHSARQPLSDSLAMIVRPVLIELLLLAPCLILLLPQSRTGMRTFREPLNAPDKTLRPIGVKKDDFRNPRYEALVWLMLSSGLCLVSPIVLNAVPLATAAASLHEQRWLMQQSIRQILVSLSFSVAAAVVALKLSAWLRRTDRRLLTVMLLLPGLSGSLMIGLTLLAAFQLPLLVLLYDTWLPMLLGLVLSVLPRAWLVVGLAAGLSDQQSLYSARLLERSASGPVRRRARDLTWHLLDSRWLLGGLVVSHWCFWNVTIASMLRPLRLEPVVTRLYNEMHYGRSEALMLISVMSTVAAPACAVMVAVIWRLLKVRQPANA